MAGADKTETATRDTLVSSIRDFRMAFSFRAIPDKGAGERLQFAMAPPLVPNEVAAAQNVPNYFFPTIVQSCAAGARSDGENRGPCHAEHF
jgi:hypothetical protein